jgi:hypothetical protein
MVCVLPLRVVYTYLPTIHHPHLHPHYYCHHDHVYYNYCIYHYTTA